ncbi:MAG: PHP domain-containing protein [Candidatus Omnitrophota bacterium]|nr:PHP domain-containing protein [Candidatus Omnitrophota bacterium]
MNQTKYADLHVHTFYSDSTFSPEEVVSCAKEKGLAAIAICDHDTVDGIDPCMAIGREKGVEIIPGIEMSVEKIDAEIHILGYFIDWKQDWLRKKLKDIQDSRVERLFVIIEKLKAAGVKIEAEEVFRIAVNKFSVGRLHVAKAMLYSGAIKNLREAFEKYIGFAKPCYVPYTKLSPEDTIGLILKAGGVPVIAHPALIGNDKYISEFMDHGLRGLEVYHTDHKPHISKRYEAMAKELGLTMTGGSDCHGMGKGRILMGTVRVPYELVEKLKEEAKKIKRGECYPPDLL